MMLQLKTGQVAGYAEGQGPLVYLTSTPRTVLDPELPFVFLTSPGSRHLRIGSTTWGCEADRIEVDGRGEEEPVAENSGPAGRLENRRVEFEVLDD